MMSCHFSRIWSYFDRKFYYKVSFLCISSYTPQIFLSLPVISFWKASFNILFSIILLQLNRFLLLVSCCVFSYVQFITQALFYYIYYAFSCMCIYSLRKFLSLPVSSLWRTSFSIIFSIILLCLNRFFYLFKHSILKHLLS